MKNKKQYLYLVYYVFLFGLLATQVVQTVYSGSLFVHRSHQLKELTRENQILSEQNYQMTTQLSKETSLHSLLSSATLAEYSEISEPIVIEDNAMVALR